jgi:dephospho-CoA kinase
MEASQDAVLQRLSGRFENDEKDIKARVRAQMSEELRREAADTIIKNDGTLEELRDQVENVFKTRINRPRSDIKKDDHDS